MTLTAGYQTPKYVTAHSDATGREELVCKHCGGAIRQTGHPFRVEWSHLDRQDENCAGIECERGGEQVAEPAIAQPPRDLSEAIFASIEQSSTAFRIRRAIARGEVKVSPEFAALAATGGDAALIAAAKTEGGAR